MYQEDVAGCSRITINDVIRAAIKNVPPEYAFKPWEHPELERGAALLSSEGALNAYIAAYGNAHKEKAFEAIKSIPFPVK